ncbi:MAG: hypothetical protein ABSH47_15650 [Bryobacteraceae bacterium]|jgi:hypothetical protein
MRTSRERKVQKSGLRDTVNEALRRGLQDVVEGQETRPRFVMRTHDPGECLLPSLDNIAEVLAAAEGERYK